MIGRVLKKRYELLQELGRSAFTVTHLAHDRERDRRCVVKVLSLRRADGPKAHELFEREAAVLARLDHPRVPRFLDFFTEETGDDLLVALVQEFVAGTDLFRLVQGGRRFTEAQVVEIGIALAGVLEYLHAFAPPILHRDIKPSNVLLAEDGTPWLVDFGAVRDKVRHDPLLAPGGPTVVGTFGYMPIEQSQGQAVTASDVSALAATLVYLLSGREPWEFDKRGLAPALRESLQVSPRLLHALERALEPDWRKRTPTATAFREALEQAQRPAPARSPRAVLAAGAAVIAVAAVVVLIGVRGRTATSAVSPASAPAAAMVEPLPPGVIRLGLPAWRHAGPVRAVAFVADGSSVASASDDGTASLWNAPRGDERWRLLLGGAARALAVSRGSVPRLALSGAPSEPVWLLDFDGREIARLVVPNERPHQAVSWGLAFDQAGTTLATIASSGRVDLWNAVDGAHLATARPCGGSGAVPVASHAGGFVVACDGRLWVRLDARLVEVGRQKVAFDAQHLLPLPDGSALGVVWRSGGFAVVDPQSGVVRPLPAEARLPEGIQAAALSADGRRLGLGLASGAVLVVDVASGARTFQVDALAGAVHAVAFSPDGTRLVSGGDDHRVSVWSLTGGSVKTTPGPPVAPPGAISALAFTPGGSSLFAATDRGLLREWGRQGALIGERNVGGPVSELGVLGDGRMVAAVGEPHGRIEESTRRIVVYDAAGKASRELVLPVGARGLALADDQRVITGGATRLDRWDLATGRRSSWPIPSGERPVAVSSDGGALVTLREPEASRGRHRLVLRDGRSGAEIASPEQRDGGPFPVTCSGARADHVLYDGRLWRVVSSPAPVLVALGTAFGNGCAVSPDGRLLALRDRPWGTGGMEPGDRVLIHKIPTAPVQGVAPLSVVAALAGHRGPLSALAFSSDSRTLATGGADGAVLLWDLDTVLPAVERSGALPWPQHAGRPEPVWSVGFEESDAGRLQLAADGPMTLDRGVVGRALFTEQGLQLGPCEAIRTGEWTFTGWFTFSGPFTTTPPQALLASPFLSLEVNDPRLPMLFLHSASGGHASVDLSAWTGPWAPGTWHHVAVVTPRVGAARICVDAICAPGPESSQPPAEPRGPIWLGPRPGRTSGRIGVDDLRLYSRSLTDAELATAARAERVRPRPTAPPTPRPAGAPALESTPEPRLPLDVSGLIAREPHPEFDVLRFGEMLATLELFDVEIGGGRVWVGTSRGLLEHDPVRGWWRLHGKAAGLPGERLFQIAWVGGRVVVDATEITRPGIGQGRGTHVFDPTTDRFSPVDLGGGQIWHMVGEGDQVWLGRSEDAQVRTLGGRGLLEAAPGRVFTSAEGALQTGAVYRIALRPDSVWFTTMGQWQRDPKGQRPSDGYFVGGGVSTWDRVRNRFQRWGVEAGLADGYGSGIAADDAEVWVTHYREDRGVSRLDRKTGRWQAFHTGSNGEKIGGMSVALTPQDVWIGSQNGLLQVDRKTLVARRFRHEHRLPGHIHYGIVEGFGALWVTVYGTANREPQGWRTQAGMIRIPLR